MELVKNIDDKRYTIMCFSDIHGNSEALKAILEERKKLKINETICLGDTISKGLDSDLCLDLLRNENIISLQGNNEYLMFNEFKVGEKTKREIEHLNWVRESLKLENLNYIKEMPTKYVLNFKDKSIQFAHFLFGSTESFINIQYLYEKGIDSKVRKYNNYDLVFYGHQHETEIRDLGNSKFISIGSSGAPLDEVDVTYYVLITYDKGNVEIRRIKVQYDRNAFINKMKKVEYPNKDYYMKTTFNIK